MIRNYFRTAFRVIARYPGYASINLFGLSVGVAVSVLLLLFVSQELTYDSFHTHSSSIYRAWVQEDYGPDQQFFNTTTPVPLAPTLKSGIPEIAETARYDRIQNVVRQGDVEFSEQLYIVDPSFLSMFSFPMEEGNLEQPFAGPASIVLTSSSAARYFGDKNPIGNTLSVVFNGEAKDFTVSSVLKNPPHNSVFEFEFLLPWDVAEWLYPARVHTAWFNVIPETYVQLNPNVRLVDLEEKIPNVMTTALGDRVEPGQYTVGLQPLTDIHLNTEMPIGLAKVSNPVYVRILLAVALLVLFIACINFVSLSLSRASSRAREIGVRKAVGAGKSQLVWQFFGEAIVFAGISITLGLALAAVLLPAFNDLSQSQLSLTPSLLNVLLVGGLFVSIALVTGLYPATVLASFRPTEAFKGSASTGKGRGLLRKSLVSVQFGISTLLLMAVLGVGSQMDYLKTVDLGFEKENVVYIPTDLSLEEGVVLAERFRTEAIQNPEIASVSVAMTLFDPAGWARIGYQASDGVYRRFFVNAVDHDFVQTMNLRLVEGRDFSRDMPTDATAAFIVNRAFVEEYGWTDPLNEKIPGTFDEHTIIGVVEDFHFKSLHSPIEPAVLSLSGPLLSSGAQDFDYQGTFASKVVVKTKGANVQETLAFMEEIWHKVAPATPFSYEFVDRDIQSQYEQESRLSTIITLGSMLTLLIAGLGLFGLAALSVAKRTREVGIRKALGASALHIVGLFGKEFSVLVALALVVALPLGYMGMDRWLATFAYRTSIHWSMFVISGVVAFSLMWMAVGLQSMRAVVANPVDSLRDQ